MAADRVVLFLKVTTTAQPTATDALVPVLLCFALLCSHLHHLFVHNSMSGTQFVREPPAETTNSMLLWDLLPQGRPNQQQETALRGDLYLRNYCWR